MTKEKTIVKLEAVRYCLDGLLGNEHLPLKHRMKVVKMLSDVETILKPFKEGRP